MSDLIQSITASIIALCGFILIVGIIALFCVYLDKDDKAKDDYIKSLNEHDKSVIADYRSSGFHFNFKKKEKRK